MQVSHFNKGTWTKKEDRILVQKVHECGAQNWSRISRYLPGRIGKQCRERWTNHLNPDIKKSKWSLWEDATIVDLHKKMGNKWCDIAKLVPGRSDNAIKNRFNSNLRRRLAAGKEYSIPTHKEEKPVSNTPVLTAKRALFAQDMAPKSDLKKRDLKLLVKQQTFASTSY